MVKKLSLIVSFGSMLIICGLCLYSQSFEAPAVIIKDNVVKVEEVMTNDNITEDKLNDTIIENVITKAKDCKDSLVLIQDKVGELNEIMPVQKTYAAPKVVKEEPKVNNKKVTTTNKTTQTKVNKEVVETKIEKTEEKAIEIIEDDLALLAALIHCEARYEPYEGKVALANIALNRVRSNRFPNTVYEVLHQRNQFTVVKKTVFKNTVKNYKDIDTDNMKETIKAATAAFNGYNNVGTRVFYNGTRWETHRSHKNPLQIGAHLFWDL